MPGKILLQDKAVELIDHVMDVVKTAVVSTMGPDGQVALIGSGSSTWTTKDGVTVAKNLQFPTDEEEIICRVISESSIKTDDECGDGTTTTIALMNVIYKLLRKDNSFKARKRVERIVKQLIAKLEEQAVFAKLDDPLLYSLALTTSNQDAELASKVIEIYRSCAKGYPDVEVKPGRGDEDLVERVDGRVINMRVADQWFMGNNNASTITLDRYIPVVVDDRVLRINPQELFDGLRSIRNQVTYEMDDKDLPVFTPIVLVVRSMEKDAINTIASTINLDEFSRHNRFGNPGVIVTMTNLGGGLGSAEMVDICSILRAPYVNGMEALSNAEVSINTTPLKVGVTRSSIHDLSEGDINHIEARIQSIEAEVAQYSYADRFSVRARINERRIRRLRGEVVTILVGGETNQEIKERVDRYVDVVKAVRSALENGILPGCGMGLLNAARAVELELSNDEEKEIVSMIGASIYYTLMKPHLGEDWAVSDIHDHFPIINIATGEEMDATDLQRMAVWDTAYATITALKGGFQTAQILATSSSIFTTIKMHGRSNQTES